MTVATKPCDERTRKLPASCTSAVPCSLRRFFLVGPRKHFGRYSKYRPFFCPLVEYNFFVKPTRPQHPVTYRLHMFRRQYLIKDCPVCGGSGWRWANAVYCSDECNRRLYALRRRYPDGNNAELAAIEERLPAARSRMKKRRQAAGALMATSKKIQNQQSVGRDRRFSAEF